jgi:homoserine O-acetyltransferase/O-succinyltransferase
MISAITHTQRDLRPSTRRSLERMVGYEITGPPRAPVIIVMGGISATRHVAATNQDPTLGWWDSTVGAGRAIDTNSYRVLGIDFLDGGRRGDGRPRHVVTTHDQAAAIVRVLDTLGVSKAHAFVGASYGGMVGLALAQRYPERLERLIAISAPHEAHPMSTALRSLQRRIVQLGLDAERAEDALAIARGLAMTTYRTAREFARRFDSAAETITENNATFPVEAYLAHHGEQFAARWSAERFLALSLSGDLHRVEPESIRTPTLIVAAEGDAIVPADQLETLAARLGGPRRLVHLPTSHGHDAFLTEPRRIGRILRTILSSRNIS